MSSKTIRDHNTQPRRTRRPLGGKFKYQQLAKQLAEEIRQDYAAGDRIASEPDLCERFEVTRNTVRKSIDLLADQGLVERRGRAGNYVVEYDKAMWDDRLICVAMPIRNHVWDQLFLSLSHQSIEHERYALISDFTGAGINDSFATVMPLEHQAERLRQMLGFRPRSLVLADPAVLGSLGDRRESFRNLIVLQGHLPVGFEHVARISVNRDACWDCCARHAREVGYKRVGVLLPPGSANLASLQEGLSSREGGGFSLDRQTVLFEHQPTWRAQLQELVRQNEPVAILCSYDWGAHLAFQTVRDIGVDVPGHVGIYGMNNTPWSIQDSLTSVHVEPDRWAAEIFAADAALEDGESMIDRQLEPVIVERASTRHT